MPAVVSVTIPDAFVPEARRAFQRELNLDDLATTSDLDQWLRGLVKDIIVRNREHEARVTAIQSIDRTDPTSA